MIEEALVSFVVSKLGDFVVGISQSFVEIRNDIVWVKGELSMMQALLRDAERRSETDEVVKEWLEQVTNIVFKIEDFLDTARRRYRLESFDDSTDPIPQDASRLCFDFLENLASRSLSFYRGTSSIAENEITIASIKKEIESISRRAQTYGLQPHHARDDGESSSTTATEITQRRPGYSAPLFEQVELVGFDEDVRQLTDWLLNEDENIQWSFMCIVGMGGSGKTALANRVCNLAHNNFDHHLWKIASEYPQANDFSRELDKAFEESRSGKLEEHRYILVIDDISDIGFCSAIMRTLPLGGRGKVILTSRQNITASLEEENCSVHKIKPLPYELAWKLFCKRAFRCSSPPGTCPPYMNVVATEIVKRCSGLPLAIVLMGGLLSTEGTIPSKWKDIIQRFDQELLHNPRLESIRHVFEASYYYLPSHLKYCFLYSCLFPKGARINRKKIIRLWVAQGFVKEQQGRPLEEVADHYFIELIERSMLEPIFSDFTGEPVSCRVHDILHALAVSKFREGFGVEIDLFSVSISVCP
ncbi:hypothetical protein AAC387_Pa07g1520 [Persea americana]